MALRVMVDRDRCCGSGMCWDTAPRFFDLDDEGIVILLRDSVDELDTDLIDGLIAAAKSCPTGTIQLERQ